MDQKYKNFFKTTGLVLFTITKYTAGVLVVLFAWFYEMQKSDSQKEMERKERLRRLANADDPRRKSERLLYQGTMDEVLDALPKRVSNSMVNLRRASAAVARIHENGEESSDLFLKQKSEAIDVIKEAFARYGDEFEVRSVGFDYKGISLAVVQNT